MVGAQSLTLNFRNKNLKLNTNKSLLYLSFAFALFCILRAGHYYIWSTYHNGIGKLVFAGLSLIVCGWLFYYLAVYQKFKASNLIWGFTITYFSLMSYRQIRAFCFNNDYLQFCNGIISQLNVALFMLLSKRDKALFFNSLITLMFILLVPGVFVWFLLFVGIDIPHGYLSPEHIGKRSAGILYNIYWGSILEINTYFAQNIDRFCGPYDEPGAIGTYLALILSAVPYRISKNVKTFILFIGGIISFSTAYFVILFLKYASNIFRYGLHKIIPSIVIFSVLVYTVLTVKVEFYPFVRLQNAFQYQNGRFVGDNRTTSSFESAYQEIFSNPIDLLFGKGVGATNSNIGLQGGSSYKIIIYDEGIILFIIYILWLFLVSAIIYKSCYLPLKYNICVFTFLFILSIYQRPDVFTPLYQLIFWGGMSNLHIHNMKLSSFLSIKRRYINKI